MSDDKFQFTEKHLKIGAILSVVLVPAVMLPYALITCDPDMCDDLGISIFDFFKMYIVTFTGLYPHVTTKDVQMHHLQR